MTNMKRLLLTSALAIAGAGGAAAETYLMSMWQPESEAVVGVSRWFSEELAKATNGEITFEVHSGGVLMPPRSHLQGIGDGVVAAGQATGGYTPSELPLTNAVGGFSFIEPDPTAIGAAYADWVLHDPAAQAEWLGHNVVPLAGFSTPTYQLICNTSQPVTELEQMKGLKVRTSGLFSALIADLGGVPVSIPGSEAYQALQTGQLDCAAFAAGHLTVDNKLAEVSKSTTMMNWGGIYISPQFAFNRDFWKGLTDEQRGIIIELSARTQAKLQIPYLADSVRALEEAKAMGHVVVEPAESLVKASEEWVANGVGDMAGIARNTYGVQDPEALFATFEPYVKKWGDLVRGMKDPSDEDELTQLLLDNMYSDIDPATYGMQ